MKKKLEAKVKKSKVKKVLGKKKAIKVKNVRKISKKKKSVKIKKVLGKKKYVYLY